MHRRNNTTSGTVKDLQQIHNRLCVQAPEASYRTHPSFPLGRQGPLEQIRGNAVLSKLREMATYFGIDKHTDFNSEVETVREQGDMCAPVPGCDMLRPVPC